MLSCHCGSVLPGTRDPDISIITCSPRPNAAGPCRLKTVEVFDVSFNALSGALSRGVCEMASLRELQLSDNKLTSLPGGMQGLLRLETLNLAYNLIAKLPPSLAGAPALTSLTLTGNPLTSPPAAVVVQGLSAVKRYLLGSGSAGAGAFPLSSSSTRSLAVGPLGEVGLMDSSRGEDAKAGAGAGAAGAVGDTPQGWPAERGELGAGGLTRQALAAQLASADPELEAELRRFGTSLAAMFERKGPIAGGAGSKRGPASAVEQGSSAGRGGAGAGSVGATGESKSSERNATAAAVPQLQRSSVLHAAEFADLLLLSGSPRGDAGRVAAEARAIPAGDAASRAVPAAAQAATLASRGPGLAATRPSAKAIPMQKQMQGDSATQRAALPGAPVGDLQTSEQAFTADGDVDELLVPVKATSTLGSIIDGAIQRSSLPSARSARRELGGDSGLASSYESLMRSIGASGSSDASTGGSLSVASVGAGADTGRGQGGRGRGERKTAAQSAADDDVDTAELDAEIRRYIDRVMAGTTAADPDGGDDDAGSAPPPAPAIEAKAGQVAKLPRPQPATRSQAGAFAPSAASAVVPGLPLALATTQTQARAGAEGAGVTKPTVGTPAAAAPHPQASPTSPLTAASPVAAASANARRRPRPPSSGPPPPGAASPNAAVLATAAVAGTGYAAGASGSGPGPSPSAAAAAGSVAGSGNTAATRLSTGRPVARLSTSSPAVAAGTGSESASAGQTPQSTTLPPGAMSLGNSLSVVAKPISKLVPSSGAAAAAAGASTDSDPSAGSRIDSRSAVPASLISALLGDVASSAAPSRPARDAAPPSADATRGGGGDGPGRYSRRWLGQPSPSTSTTTSSLARASGGAAAVSAGTGLPTRDPEAAASRRPPSASAYPVGVSPQHGAAAAAGAGADAGLTSAEKGMVRQLLQARGNWGLAAELVNDDAYAGDVDAFADAVAQEALAREGSDASAAAARHHPMTPEGKARLRREVLGRALGKGDAGAAAAEAQTASAAAVAAAAAAAAASAAELGHPSIAAASAAPVRRAPNDLSAAGRVQRLLSAAARARGEPAASETPAAVAGAAQTGATAAGAAVQPEEEDDNGEYAELMEGCPEAFICPITYQALRDPVVAADGHTYERRAIEKWLQKKNKSPMTGQTLSSKVLAPNHILRSMITDFRDKALRARVSASLPVAAAAATTAPQGTRAGAAVSGAPVAESRGPGALPSSGASAPAARDGGTGSKFTYAEQQRFLRKLERESEPLEYNEQGEAILYF